MADNGQCLKWEPEINTVDLGEFLWVDVGVAEGRVVRTYPGDVNGCKGISLVYLYRVDRRYERYAPHMGQVVFLWAPGGGPSPSTMC